MGILIFATVLCRLCFSIDVNCDLAKNARLLIASKDRGTVKLITNTGAQLKTITELTASFVARPGDKDKSGDKKTPSGVYFPVKLLSNDELPDDSYGPMAVELNYPNPIDVEKKKTGHSIWIHGTKDNARLGSKTTTHGCIIVDNKSLLFIIKNLRLHKTPVIILDVKDSIQINVSSSEITNVYMGDGTSKYKISTGLEKNKDIVYEVIG